MNGRAGLLAGRGLAALRNPLHPRHAPRVSPPARPPWSPLRLHRHCASRIWRKSRAPGGGPPRRHRLDDRSRIRARRGEWAATKLPRLMLAVVPPPPQRAREGPCRSPGAWLPRGAYDDLACVLFAAAAAVPARWRPERRPAPARAGSSSSYPVVGGWHQPRWRTS